MKLGDLQISENFYDILLLLGVDYAKNKYFEADENIIDELPFYPSDFAKLLDEIIYNLKFVLSAKLITRYLKLPRDFFILFGINRGRAAHCYLCDEHFNRIRDHLGEFHSLSSENIDAFIEKYPIPRFNMPKPYKKLQRLMNPKYP